VQKACGSVLFLKVFARFSLKSGKKETHSRRLHGQKACGSGLFLKVLTRLLVLKASI